MAYASDESMFEYLNVVSKMFDSEAEGYEFYNKYALEKAQHHGKQSSFEQADSKESTNAQHNNIRFGPLMAHSEKVDKVLDPVHVPGRGAPKKRLQAKTKKSRSQNICGYCKNPGHNRRKCAKLLEDLEAEL
ncbi:hypothetical protein VPH35_115538 [Triticum aestivum]